MAIIAFDPEYEGMLISKQAEEAGLVGIGGNLSIKSLLSAYSSGLFPWYTEGEPIMWWSPDPRTLLIPEKFKLSHSLRQTLRKNKFQVTVDTVFPQVINACRVTPRKDQTGTWITSEVEKAYTSFHKAGYAHSFETWFEGKLVGGLYGVSLGKAFFGESMFHHMTDASKVAFYYLVQFALHHGFLFIDAQMKTEHLLSLGAETIPRAEFLKVLQSALQWPTIKGKWTKYFQEIQGK
ncbi:MAG: leucyl/phenylalanyl-tRNA---protein transferase [Bacteroidales bacterium]|jgi:leucyl/phenylalanyl-tRNA--protein transferase|nr:leucyl/phenylalanyl-tRNA---protein transferase [Bacteroidales bacterium]MDN5329959.1 leucyl/phenylalanyl-tRNA---protein transferase [Bacteroidales bacterium]NLH53269.1 leucyl/phenylalanyl-tRNA--protein transferase [Bacteroidales bacterium]NPV36896.1 leucyl/phenylalanyl-tRNA--protein transferase [Bacteroidales bacterium]